VGRILLIEDDPGAQLLFKNRLEDLGHQVVVMPTGAMGLMEARAEPFDLFLVDVGLGSGIDGYEVCRRLKATPHVHGIPVVLISGQVKGQEELHKGYEAGCEAFLLKGDIILLEDVVRAMLRIKSLQDDLGMQNRLLEEQNRRLSEERQRGADLEVALRETGGRALVFRELAAGRPDGVLMVDADGVVRFTDRGAQDILGKDIEGKNLARLAPGTGLEAFVRNARTEPSEAYRFDLTDRKGRAVRSISASVMPTVPRHASRDNGYKVVLLLDAGRRRVASEMLRLQERGIPRRELGPLLEAARDVYHPSGIIGASPAMRELRKRVSRAALTDGPVLIRGESGTGKQLVARALHFGGLRSGPFVPVNCAAMAPGLLVSELFGHVKSAFPGAISDRPGLFQQAHLGTIYLDQVEAVPLELQPKLEVVLEEREVYRVGATAAEHVDVRMIASTNADLEGMIAEERFRSDLYYRLNVVDLEIPPLRDRESDALLLAQHFLKRHGAAREHVEFSPEVLWVLQEHDWPGNVRELENCVERACALAEGQRIEVSDLPLHLRELHRRLREEERAPPALIRAPGAQGRSIAERFAMEIEPQPPPSVAPGEPAEPVSLQLYEKRALLRALEETGGDKLAAARLLGVGKSTFYRKLRAHGLS
jgi:DNA-binding NtrC family response regulator